MTFDPEERGGSIDIIMTRSHLWWVSLFDQGGFRGSGGGGGGGGGVGQEIIAESAVQISMRLFELKMLAFAKMLLKNESFDQTKYRTYCKRIKLQNSC